MEKKPYQILSYFKFHFHNEGGHGQKSYFKLFSTPKIYVFSVTPKIQIQYSAFLFLYTLSDYYRLKGCGMGLTFLDGH